MLYTKFNLLVKKCPDKIILLHATKIAKEEIDRICQDRYKQQRLKAISKDCCNILSDFKNFDIGRKTYTKKKYKNKKKYKTFWKKKKRRFTPGKYFKKSSKDNILLEQDDSLQTSRFEDKY